MINYTTALGLTTSSCMPVYAQKVLIPGISLMKPDC